MSLKLSHGMTKPWPTAAFAVCALLSFALLTIALRRIEVGTAYAVWTGIGAVGTAVTGMIWLGDAVSTLKLVSTGLVLAGVAGLYLSGVTPGSDPAAHLGEPADRDRDPERREPSDPGLVGEGPAA